MFLFLAKFFLFLAKAWLLAKSFCFSQSRDDWLFEPNVSLDKSLAISKLLQVPSLDTLLTCGQVIISTQRAKDASSKLTQSPADGDVIGCKAMRMETL